MRTKSQISTKDEQISTSSLPHSTDFLTYCHIRPSEYGFQQMKLRTRTQAFHDFIIGILDSNSDADPEGFTYFNSKI